MIFATQWHGHGAFLALVTAFAAATPAGAGDQAASALRGYCVTKLELQAHICDCLLRQFGKLNDGQQALVEAQLSDQKAVLPALRAALLPADARQAESFLARETLLCRPSGLGDYRAGRIST